MEYRFRRGDAAAAALVLLLAGLSLLLLRPSRAGAVAVVSVDGAVVHTLELAGPARDVTLEGLPHPMTLHIENGAVSVRESGCPGGDCVRQGAVSRGGESLVCLPNRVTVVVAAEESSDLDAVAG